MISRRSPTASPNRRDDADSLVGPVRRDPDLDRAEALARPARSRPRPAVPADAARPTRRTPGISVSGAAEQRRHRPPHAWPKQVPQRRLERPVATGVKRDRLERPRMARDGDAGPGRRTVKQNHQSRPSCRRSRSRPDPRRSRRARSWPRTTAGDRVPGGVERRVQRQAQPLEADRGDHQLNRPRRTGSSLHRGAPRAPAPPRDRDPRPRRRSRCASPAEPALRTAVSSDAPGSIQMHTNTSTIAARLEQPVGDRVEHALGDPQLPGAPGDRLMAILERGRLVDHDRRRPYRLVAVLGLADHDEDRRVAGRRRGERPEQRRGGRRPAARRARR